MANKPKVTIIGLGLIGASMGLGLQREDVNFEIVGHDKTPEVGQAAKKEGAVHRTEWNLYRACEGAELVILAVPLNELDETLELLRDDVKPGTLYFAINSLLQPAIEIADRHLPANAHFVVGHPVITGIGGLPTMRADLFDKAVFALAAGLKTEPSAVQLASDFVDRVGATPLFVDAQEHDGIIAGVEQLPQLLALALMRVSAASGGWREARRLAGQSFAAATDVGENPSALFAGLRANRQNLLYRIRQLQQELSEWHDLLEAEVEGEQVHPLQTSLEKAVEDRITWEAQASLKNWEERPTSATPGIEAGGFFRQMFLGNLGGKRGRS